MPQVSVVVSLYNHARYLATCVESVLAQTFGDLELVIVDDGSTDGGLDVAHGLAALDPARVRVLANPGNLGVSRTRNFGAFKSTGDILAFLDADDYWAPDKLEHQVRAFAQDPDLGVCHTGAAVEHDPEDKEWVRLRHGMCGDTFDRWSASFDAFCCEACAFDPLAYFERLLVGNNICLSSVAVRREAFRLARGFVDGERCQCEDWLLWLKLSLVTRFRALPRALTVYRFHAQSHTAQVLMRPDFQFLEVREEVVRAARAFDPARFDALFAQMQARRARR